MLRPALLVAALLLTACQGDTVTRPKLEPNHYVRLQLALDSANMALRAIYANHGRAYVVAVNFDTLTPPVLVMVGLK